jgi:hypothetical protein
VAQSTSRSWLVQVGLRAGDVARLRGGGQAAQAEVDRLEQVAELLTRHLGVLRHLRQRLALVARLRLVHRALDEAAPALLTALLDVEEARMLLKLREALARLLQDALHAVPPLHTPALRAPCCNVSSVC